MTIFDLTCDRCGTPVSGPEAGQRYIYHPGNRDLADNSSLECGACWADTEVWLGSVDLARCGVCGVIEPQMLCVQSVPKIGWRLCRRHTIDFLNRLRTVDPKLTPDSFEWPEAPP